MGRITVNGTISQFSAKLTVPERLWEVRGGRAKGRSLEADRINRHLDDIRSQLDRHYRDIRDRESYVTAEKVKNAWLGSVTAPCCPLSAALRTTCTAVSASTVRKTRGTVILPR